MSTADSKPAGKTATIRKRRVDIYLPSLEAKARWTELAREAGTSLRKFIPRVVEEAFAEGTPGLDPAELQEELEALQNQLQVAQERIRMLEALREKLDVELRRYRAEAFLEPGAGGVRSLDQGLISLLKETIGHQGKPKAVKADRILALLGIKPTETEAIRAVNAQLETLVNYGLVKSSSSGYRWCE